MSLPFWLAAATLVALAVARRHAIARLARGERVLLAAAAISALTVVGAARNAAFFAVLAAPALSYLWTLAAAAPHQRQRPAPAAAYVLIALAVLAGATFVTFRWRDGGVALGWRPIENAAIEAVRRCPDPLFNHLEDGGYLMWTVPERRVFIDSRMEA